MKVCRCGPKFSFDNARREPAPADWQANEAWVCGRCNGISHAVQEEVAVVRGPSNSRAVLSARGKRNGQTILTWAVGPQDGKERTQVETVEFFPWPRRFPMTETEPLIFKTWELLMSKVEVILAEPKGVQDNEIEALKRSAARSEARGIAEVLAIQMAPFMESADHVVRSAVKAYSDPGYEVPGLGLHLWDPMKNPDGSPRTPVAAPKKQAAKPAARPKVDNKSTRKLTPEEAAGIKEAISSGMFQKDEIASMFKVSIKTVEEAIGG